MKTVVRMNLPGTNERTIFRIGKDVIPRKIEIASLRRDTKEWRKINKIIL